MKRQSKSNGRGAARDFTPKPAAKNKEGMIWGHGIVLEVLRNAQFRVKLDRIKKENDEVVIFDRDITILGIACGKMHKRNKIKIIKGDSVDMEISKHDMTKGRITRRHKE